MTPEWPLLMGIPLLALFIALPGAAAWRRRHRSRLAGDAAVQLTAFAERVRRERRCSAPEAALYELLRRLRLRETVSLQMAMDLDRSDPLLLSAAAHRLALRLRRRVAFERKMLARTAPGLRRGAIAAALPPIVMLALGAADVGIPMLVQGLLLSTEMFGCVLLWQCARVEI